MSEARFTVVFEGDIRKFDGNPFHADTPFGRPRVIDADDVIAERDALAEALEAIVALDDGDMPSLWPHSALFDAARAALSQAQPQPSDEVDG